MSQDRAVLEAMYAVVDFEVWRGKASTPSSGTARSAEGRAWR